MLKVSIITISMNDAPYIEDCLRSVHAQDYEEIEHIVVDGGSSDGTLDILSRHPPRNGVVISEKDDGIYDAINKGLLIANGDVVALLNSDNFYESCRVVSQIVRALETSGAELVYADAYMVDPDETSVVHRVWKGGEFSPGLFDRGWMPPHQTVFLYRRLHDSFGFYDTSFRIAADYEFLLRILVKHSVSCAYLPSVIVRARIGGVSNRSLWSVIQANLEVLRAWAVNGLRAPVLLLILKPFKKLSQLTFRGALSFRLACFRKG